MPGSNSLNPHPLWNHADTPMPETDWGDTLWDERRRLEAGRKWTLAEEQRCRVLKVQLFYVTQYVLLCYDTSKMTVSNTHARTHARTHAHTHTQPYVTTQVGLSKVHAATPMPYLPQYLSRGHVVGILSGNKDWVKMRKICIPRLFVDRAHNS